MAIIRFPVDITWPGTGGPGVNVWHFRTGGSDLDDSEVSGLSDIVHAFYADGWSIIAPTDAHASFAGLYYGVGLNEGEASSVAPWSEAGAQPDPTLPLATQVVVNWLTNSGGRRGRGKTFLGPVAASVNADGSPNGAYLNDVGTAAAALIESSDSLANGAVAVWSPTDEVARDFTGYRMTSKFAVLRSRRD